MSDKLNQGMIKNFNWHWDHQQGAVFLKKDEIYAHRKNLAEFFYRAGHASRDAEVAVLKEKLWAAEGRIKGMTEGLEILKGEK